VDESIPELTIAVVPSRRGRGFGEELLAGLLERARQEGYEALSLSVEKENPALRLYERFGFRPVSEIGDSVVMRADLATASREGQTL
jgi:ribosomal protein S18 acetylase RimI-like enzyme